MQILHLSYSDDRGGAARAAYRVHQGLRNVGMSSTMLVREKGTDDPTVFRWNDSAPLPTRAIRWLRGKRIANELKHYESSRPKERDLFTDSRTDIGSALANNLPGAEVVNIHWVSHFMDWGVLSRPELAHVPIVLTLHDLSPFTGGCHCSSACNRFEQKCGACPQLGSQKQNDFSRRNWERKRLALAGRTARNLYVAANSDWIAAEARRSSLLGGFPIRTVHFGLDTDIFKPRDRQSARKSLGLQEDASVVLFSATNIGKPSKGLVFLLDALSKLQCGPIILLLLGGGVAPKMPPNLEHVRLGTITNDLFLSVAYSAADIFVTTSLAESFGLAALEANACGIPVVGFATGGIPDAIEDGNTGYLVEPRDTTALKNRIDHLLSDRSDWQRLSANARVRVINRFSLQAQSERYRGLYLECCSVN